MSEPADLRASLGAAIAEIEALNAQLDALEEPIAIVGIGCRLPGASDVEQAWDRLRQAEPACSDPPPSRAAIAEALDPDPEAAGRTYCAKAGYIFGLEMFDAGFFRMLPAQADALDPQQRLLLETSWNAIEDAGVDPLTLKDSRTGVYVGLSFDDYAGRTAAFDPQATLGTARSLAAGRISYLLDLKGPAVQLDTACSSSAVALHQAVRALRGGECDLALAGGANAIIGAEPMIRLSKMKALSPHGRSRSFEARADGYGRGEGAVVFLLSRLSDALARNQRVYAVVRGSAVNHDGASNGLTAPNGRAQQAVIRAALDDAHADPADVGFIEAHGTGTPLGDPIEAAALAKVFEARRPGEILLGSSKAVFGHLEAAAGALGVLKAALCLNQGMVTAQPAGCEPTARIAWDDIPLRLAVTASALAPAASLAGVSAFGMSGTNAHLVLEKAPAPAARPGGAVGIALLSAASAPGLRRRAADLARWISRHPEATSADLERSLLARAGLAHRAVFDLATPAALADGLQAFADGDPGAALASGVAAEPRPPIESWSDRSAVVTAYVAGAAISPSLAGTHPGRPLSLPTYPYDRARHWVDGARPPPVPAAQPTIGGPVEDAGDIKASLRALLARLMQIPVATLNDRTPFIEIGADSLILLDAVRTIEQRHGVEIPMGQLFAGLSTIETLAAYVAEQSGAQPAAPQATAPRLDPPASSVPQPVAAPSDPTARSSYFENLVDRYAKRHAGSKAQASASRIALADSRRAVGFRPSLKEALFPIVGARAEGAYVWDVDGNRFVDTAMGFGVYLFGHGHARVEAAIDGARRSGLPVGPQSPDAGEVAEALCRLTGFERAAFCNTGTEAVMTALRLARAATKRHGVALFSGSYHGHFDGVLGAAGQGLAATPATPGVTPAFVSDLMVLDYGAESALEALDRHGASFAAVLVEPVQSRNPGLQPRAFLHRLRELADRHGFALIFDEVLTGLRVHPAGAQALFGVKPDLATYGKILGGGLPIGAVAGARRFLDGIDGGIWNYADASAPIADRVFFGGTFNKNALSMAAAKAVLAELDQGGPDLQDRLNARTAAMVGRLREGIRAEGYPVTVVHFGSLFRFGFTCNPDAFYLELACRGVYVWEGRNCFLSTAHDDHAIDLIVDAALASLKAMRDGGLLEARREARAEPVQAIAPSGVAAPRAVVQQLTLQGLPAVGSDHAERTRQLDAAATAFAVGALRQLALQAGEDGAIDPRRLAERLEMSVAGGKLIDTMVGWLGADGLLERKDSGWSWRGAEAVRDPASALNAARALGGEAESALLKSAGAALAEVLCRARHPLDALAPGGDFQALSDIYIRPALAQATNQLLGEACRALAAPIADGGALDILELGAGTGSATRALIEALSDRPFSYHATDLSTAFFDPDRGTYPADARLSFGRYDIDQPAAEQELPPGGFDLIVASNALHVAQDLDFTLGQLTTLLKPGGVLVLNELTLAPRWLQLTFGITDGWWTHRDLRRGVETPLLSAAAWAAAFSSAGLPMTAAIAPGGPDGDPGGAILMGQKRDAMEASRAQQQLVALATVDPDGAGAYNLSMVVDIEGPVDAAALARAITEEARAHDILSAVFVEDPIRLVFGAARVAESITRDLSDEDDPEAAAGAWCAGFADMAFDLGAGPLFRSAVIILGEGRSRVALTTPHVVADALSLATIWEGAVRRCDGRAPAPAPAPSFARHLTVERQWLVSDEAERQRAYWGARLPAPAAPGETAWAGGVVEGRLGRDLAETVTRRARTAGMTPFMFYFAAFALVMRSAHQPAVLGVPVSGRRRAAEGLVGYCTHLLPISVAASVGVTAGGYLAAVRETLIEAFAHQDLPFAEMRRGAAPRVDVTFNLDAGALSAPEGGTARMVGWESRREPFPLRVNLTAENGDLLIEIGHQSARYGREAVEELIARFRDALRFLSEADALAPLPEGAIVSGPDEPAAGSSSSAGSRASPPGDPALELCLAEAIGKALGVDAVGPDDDFFELGGDSIVSLQAAAAARRAGYAIDAKTILSHRTVRAMAFGAARLEPLPADAPAPPAADAQLTLGGDDYDALLAVFED